MGFPHKVERIILFCICQHFNEKYFKKDYTLKSPPGCADDTFKFPFIFYSNLSPIMLILSLLIRV